jgi:hypothetical protein
MKALLIMALAFAALICALLAAYLWGRSTRVRPEPVGFEPVIPELQHNWWRMAEWTANERSARFNSNSAWLTAIAALLGFASLAVSMWPS